jgi:hypothetical protein
MMSSKISHRRHLTVPLLAITLLVIGAPILAVGSAQAQVAGCGADSVAAAYDANSIHLTNSFFGGYRYHRNGVTNKAGGSMKHLAAEFVDYPVIHSVAMRGVQTVRKGRFLSFVGILAGLSNLFIDDTGTQIVANTSAFLLTSIGTAVQVGGRNDLRESVRLYNRRLLECK